jgi:hypothetical protein
VGPSDNLARRSRVRNESQRLHKLRVTLRAVTDWLDSESDLLSWRRELDRLKRRARKRLVLTLALALIGTVGVVWMMSRRVPLAESRILIRVTEGSVLREDAPISASDLGEFLRDSAFSNRNLLQLINKHGLYPFERARGDIYALEEIRAHLTLEVYRNYFLEARGYNSDVRTARISVRFKDEDPAVSFAICSDLAKLIIDSEARRREDTSRGVASITQRAVDSAVETLEDRRAELSTKLAQLTEAERAGKNEEVATLKVDISRLKADVTKQADVVRRARESKGRADLRVALDSEHINLLYQIVDERPPPPPEAGKHIRLAMIGLACFLIFLPLSAVAVGAFDSRIHDPEDVQRLGLEVVGHVPRFPGFGVGSMRGRRDAERRRT